MHVGGKLSGAAVRGHFKAGPLDVARVVSSDPLGRSDFKGESKLFQAEQISSMVLTKMKETAEAYQVKAGDSLMAGTNPRGESKLFQAEQISSMVLTKMKETAKICFINTARNVTIVVSTKVNSTQR